MNYADWDAYDLVEALELSGETPPPDLFAEILARGPEMDAELLPLLEAAPDESWADDDPRWFRDVHAGLLLIERTAPDALPVLETIYRDEERAASLAHWFSPRLVRYGEAALPFLERLLDDPEMDHPRRVGAVIGLSELAQVPALRGRIVPRLRALLPPLDADGQPELPDDEEVGYAEVEAWTWAAVGLQHAHDVQSRDHVLALFEAEVIDDWVLDPDEFLEALDAPDADGPPALPALPAYYQQQRDEEARMLEQLEEVQELGGLAEQFGELQEALGLDEREMTELMERLEAAVGEDGEIDEARAQQEMMSFLAERGGLGGLSPEALAGGLPPGALGAGPPAVPVEVEKIGRNEHVTIQDPETGQTETLKYKHAQAKLAAGWQVVGRSG